MSVTNPTPLKGTGVDYKSTLLPLLVSRNVLSFGSFTLKSGRESPYFFTSTLLHTAPLLRATASAYADVISSPPYVTISDDGKTTTPNFDIVFGPAYKGIIPAIAVVNELALRDHLSGQRTWNNISYSFNRKEKKDHGEGGSIVGAALKGKRVLVVDDVITAGTALREAVSIIESAGGSVVGVVVLLDRQERVSDSERKSALGVAQRTLGEKVPVRAVFGFNDLIERLGDQIAPEHLMKMKEYREKYQAE